MAAGLLGLLGPVAAQAGTSVLSLLGGACAILLLIISAIILSIMYSTVWWVVGVLAGIGGILLYAQCVHPKVFGSGSGSSRSFDVGAELPTLALSVADRGPMDVQWQRAS